MKIIMGCLRYSQITRSVDRVDHIVIKPIKRFAFNRYDSLLFWYESVIKSDKDITQEGFSELYTNECAEQNV